MQLPQNRGTITRLPVSDSPLFGLTIPERRQSGTKGGVLAAAAERRKSKKCSVFDTIAESSQLDADTEQPRLSSIQRFRKESVKLSFMI